GMCQCSVLERGQYHDDCEWGGKQEEQPDGRGRYNLNECLRYSVRRRRPPQTLPPSRRGSLPQTTGKYVRGTRRTGWDKWPYRRCLPRATATLPGIPSSCPWRAAP